MGTVSDGVNPYQHLPASTDKMKPMVALIQDPLLEEEIIAKRRETGADRFDEVWEGIYVMSPLANNEHQRLVGKLTGALLDSVDLPGLGIVLPGANITDQQVDWTKNFRCPDVAVFLNDSQAENRDTHWFGGPDFTVEIVSPHDRTREKVDFYARVNTRELLIVDRDPWALELFRLEEGKLISVGTSTVENGETLSSDVVPLSLKLIAGEKRPSIEIKHNDGEMCWTV